MDDNLLLGSLLQIMLEDEGHQTLFAADGQAGLAAALFFHPDVVVTDLQMPRVNGLEMMGRIRRAIPGVKAIYMSGEMESFGDKLREETSRYAAGILPKPFSRDDLLGLLSRFAGGGGPAKSPASAAAPEMGG